jgi:hypothetical protein
MVDVHIEHGEKRIRVAFRTICFDSSAYCWLCKNKFCELVSGEDLCVPLEKLLQELVYRMVVDLGVRVEKVKVDIYKRLLFG